VQGGGEKIIRAVVLREAGRGKGLPLWMTKTIELGDEVRIARDEVESEGGKEKAHPSIHGDCQGERGGATKTSRGEAKGYKHLMLMYEVVSVLWLKRSKSSGLIKVDVPPFALLRTFGPSEFCWELRFCTLYVHWKAGEIFPLGVLRT